MRFGDAQGPFLTIISNFNSAENPQKMARGAVGAFVSSRLVPLSALLSGLLAWGSLVRGARAPCN